MTDINKWPTLTVDWMDTWSTLACVKYKWQGKLTCDCDSLIGKKKYANLYKNPHSDKTAKNTKHTSSNNNHIRYLKYQFKFIYKKNNHFKHTKWHGPLHCSFLLNPLLMGLKYDFIPMNSNKIKIHLNFCHKNKHKLWNIKTLK